MRPEADLQNLSGGWVFIQKIQLRWLLSSEKLINVLEDNGQLKKIKWIYSGI